MGPSMSFHVNLGEGKGVSNGGAQVKNIPEMIWGHKYDLRYVPKLPREPQYGLTTEFVLAT